MLQTSLNDLCRRLDGSIAASVIAADGAIVEAIRATGDEEEPDLDALWADYVALLNNAGEHAQMLAAGGLREVLISTERLITVMRPFNGPGALDYYVTLAARPGSNTAKARYLCRVVVPDLVEAIA